MVSSSGKALGASSAALAVAGDRVSGPPACLLHFYATECALKAAIVKHHKVGGWDGLTADIRSEHQHHDLRRLARATSMGGAAARDLIDCRQRGTAERVHIREAHAAWRYGVKLNPTDETRLVGALVAVREWIAQRL